MLGIREILVVTFLGAVVGFVSFSTAIGGTVIDNSSDPAGALFTFPRFTISAPGKWTMIVSQKMSVFKFQSIDGTQRLQVALVDLYPKVKGEDEKLFHEYVDGRRMAEHENIGNKALVVDPIAFAPGNGCEVASWSVVDVPNKFGYTTAVLHSDRQLLNIYYEAQNVPEPQFREMSAKVRNSMALKKVK